MSKLGVRTPARAVSLSPPSPGLRSCLGLHAFARIRGLLNGGPSELATSCQRCDVSPRIATHRSSGLRLPGFECQDIIDVNALFRCQRRLGAYHLTTKSVSEQPLRRSRKWNLSGKT